MTTVTDIRTRNGMGGWHPLIPSRMHNKWRSRHSLDWNWQWNIRKQLRSMQIVHIRCRHVWTVSTDPIKIKRNATVSSWTVKLMSKNVIFSSHECAMLVWLGIEFRMWTKRTEIVSARLSEPTSHRHKFRSTPQQRQQKSIQWMLNATAKVDAIDMLTVHSISRALKNKAAAKSNFKSSLIFLVVSQKHIPHIYATHPSQRTIPASGCHIRFI